MVKFTNQAFTYFDNLEGFREKDIFTLCADKKGNMWFGSDVRSGTERGDAFCYDGKSFTNITAKENLTIKEDQAYNVRTIVEDNNGNIWIGSRAGLLIRYDGKSFVDFSEKVSK